MLLASNYHQTEQALVVHIAQQPVYFARFEQRAVEHLGSDMLGLALLLKQEFALAGRHLEAITEAAQLQVA